ncbi:DNA-processing protein DprA [Epidermidibacterium keratini]
MWAYVSAEGAVDVAAQLHAGEGPVVLQRAVGARVGSDDSVRDLHRAERAAVRLLIPGDSDWPGDALWPMQQVAADGDLDCVPPLSLWVRGAGSLPSLLARSIAIVGARASTPYGEQVTHQLAAELAERGVCVVSGGAFGIDAAAHRAALSAGRPTIAVLACGADRAYPKANEALLDRISRDGLLLSEWPPGAAPMRQRFLVRNRLIAGLTAGTVVVEAALRSGARSTASRARDLGKPVMAVPGPVTSAMSAGTLAMLRAGGCIAVGSAAHVLDAIGRIGDDLAPHEAGPSEPIDELDPQTQAVYDAVPLRRASPIESIATVAALAVSDAVAAMSVLELLGLVEVDEGRWRKTRQDQKQR